MAGGAELRGRSCEAHGAAIGAWVAAAGEDAGARLAQNNLAAAEESAFPAAYLPDTMAAARKLSHYLGRDALLERHQPGGPAAFDAEARQIECCLGVEARIR